MGRTHLQPRQNMNSHSGALEHIIEHLDELGLNKKRVAFTLPEPNIYKQGSVDKDKCCDIVIGFEEPYNHSYLIEVKHSSSSKAQSQLYNTAKRFCDRIGYPAERYFIYYYPSRVYEEIKF